MTTLDDVFEQMQIFDRALLEFNEALRLSVADLRKSDEEISALWQDEASARYRRVYEPLAESLDRYLRTDAPRFEGFLQAKVRQLGIYLHGQ
jgi:hypothetical protein